MKKRVIILTAFFILLYTGCGEKQDSPVNSNSYPQLPSDVPPDVKLLLDNYSAAEDINLPEIAPAPPNFDFRDINDSIYDAFVVVFIWGQLLPLGQPANGATVWDGSLSINGPSFVKTVAPIDFEQGQDSLVTEAVSSAENWGSTTHRGFDGLVFLVLYDKVTPTFAPQVLTFQTPPINLQFDFSQLISLYAYYQVDRVNGVAVHARKVRLSKCLEGYMNGHWHKSDTSDFTGNFRGLWFAHNGDTIGVMSGHFWKTDDGAQLLKGWVSGVYTDKVIMELHGVWFFDDPRMCPMCGSGHGQFKGRFQILNSLENGYFLAEFGDYSLPPNDRVMPLHGRWHVNCRHPLDMDDPATR